MVSGEEKVILDEENLDAENISTEKIISVYLDRIEDLEDGTADAVLLLDDGEDEYSAQIVLPANLLPDDVSEGDYLNLKISYDEEKTKAALETARQLLKS